MAVKREPIVPNPGVVNVSPRQGEHLFFRLDANGPIPIFSFASSIKGTLFEAPDFIDHPASRYEWLHLRNPSDVQQLERLTLLLSFFSNSAYEYLVEHRARNGSPIATVLHVKFTADDPRDTASESFTVVIV